MCYLQDALQNFAIHSPRQVAKTGIATVWQVDQSDGTPAALKIYHDLDEKGEGAGFEVLSSWSDGPAARVLGRAPGVVLLEWLVGPRLGDLSRAGRDAEANATLVETAQAAHRIPIHDLSGFRSLEDTFQPLFDLTFTSDCPPDVKRSVMECKTLSRYLFQTSPPGQLLHGDLHHDNVLKGERGWCVIDPKGVVGDPAYELANAFRNPLGQDKLIRDPHRIQSLAKAWASACGATPRRVLAWAACHACVSMAWSLNGPLGLFPDSDLPGVYLKQMTLADQI